MYDLLLDLINVLADAGVVAGDGIDSFRDFRPDQPDFAISLIEYPAAPPELGVEAVPRSVQISVRADIDDPDAARQKAWEIFNVLCIADEPILDTRETLAGTRWGVISARQVPFKMEVDSSNRFIYGFNLAIVTHRD